MVDLRPACLSSPNGQRQPERSLDTVDEIARHGLFSKPLAWVIRRGGTGQGVLPKLSIALKHQATNWALGVDREIANSSGVMSTGTSANKGVLR